jgi:2-polyprenyl-3-methyl-5-hydroxy-6-metoxy-1,4-benzoquinol methylase
MSKVHYATCPVCSSAAIDPLLTVKDYSVTGEAFVIWQCRHCTLRFTQEVPDEGSIGRYYQSADYISHSNTSKGLTNKLYQQVRKHTLGLKASLVINHTVKEGTLLDIGAGIGAFMNEMKSRGWEVRGIEPDPGAREQAMHLYGLPLLTPSSLFDLPGAGFEAISLWHVLEHVQSLHEYVAQVKELLKEKGRLFIAVPNYESLDAAIYRNHWAAYDVPRHRYHFTPKSIHTLVNRHGMRLIDQQPMWFDAFYISLLSSKYQRGKTNWITAGINGLRSNIKTLFNRKKASSIVYIVAKD